MALPDPARASFWLAGLALLLALLLAGCTGALVNALEQREVASCVWWTSPFARGVSSTGGQPLSACLALPCPCALR